MKVCSRCKEEKEESEFQKRKRSTDGLRSECKSCSSIYSKSEGCKNSRKKYKLSEKGKIQIRKYIESDGYKKLQKKYYSSINYRLSKKLSTKKTRIKFPEKRKASLLLCHAISDGKINKPNNCSICGSENKIIHGHHEDYSKPLDVIWLCCKCHGKIHKFKKMARTAA